MNYTGAKQKLEEFIIQIDEYLQKYWQEEVSKDFGFNQRQKELVRKIINHSGEHNLRQAKRLRASYVYYSYMLGGDKQKIEEVMRAAMAVELVHTALLMHDDVMDQDDVRRGKPTTHKYFEEGDAHYGESMAINAGDAVLLLGYELLNRLNFEPERIIKAQNQFLRGVTNTAFGQAYDVSLERYQEWKEDDVLSLHKAKTAIYTYENPLLIGAYLANLPPDTEQIIHDYSMDGGVAFQLQDDILGVYGNPEKTGKSANSDLLQGKVTLLILKTLELGSESEKEAVKKVWGKRRAETTDIEAAKEAIKTSGAYEYSLVISRDLAHRAAQTAEKLRGLNLNEEAIDYIGGIAEYMVHRDL